MKYSHLNNILKQNCYLDPLFSKGKPLAKTNVQNIAYQIEDIELVSEDLTYNLGQLHGTNIYLRNFENQHEIPENYVCIVGAAQAFGRGVSNPYGEQVANKLGMDSVNLGVGGVGPSYFFLNSKLLDIINGSQLCLINIMSPRSVDLEDCKPTGSCVFHLNHDDRWLFWNSYYNLHVRQYSEPALDFTQRLIIKFIEDFQKLRSLVSVPIIFVNFSSKSGNYVNGNRIFPQFLTPDSLEQLRSIFPTWIDCDQSDNQESSPGLTYYLSQIGHNRAAAAIMDHLKK